MIFRSRTKAGPAIEGEAGFSFLAMVLILLLLVLGGVALTTALRPTLSSANLRTTNERVAELRVAIANYKVNHGGTTAPPTLAALVTDDGVVCDVDNVSTSATYLTLQGWCGPYIDQLFTNFPLQYQSDGWGTPLSYNTTSLVLTSCGPDLTCGTSDDIAFSP